MLGSTQGEDRESTGMEEETRPLPLLPSIRSLHQAGVRDAQNNYRDE
jgi:hypothetical protein